MCKINLLSLDEIPIEKEISLRSIATKQSQEIGRSFLNARFQNIVKIKNVCVLK